MSALAPLPPSPPLTWSGRLGVVGFFFFAYMLASSRALPWSDAKLIHQVAESVVARHAVDIETPWFRGRDGKGYSVHPALAALIHVPGAYLAFRLQNRVTEPDARALLKAVTSHIGPALMGAIAALAFYETVLELGVSLLAAVLATSALAFGTILSVYARYPYSEAAQTAMFTLFFAALLRLTRAPQARSALWVGFWAGMLINTKIVYALSLLGGGGFALWQLRRDPRQLARVVPYALLGLLPGLVMTLAYNQARWGAPLANPYYGDFGPPERLYVGLWGLLLSPSKSLFLYSPPLLLSFLALRRLASPRASRLRPVLLAILLTTGPIIFLTARLTFWSGDLAWGARYLVFLVPVFLLPAALWLDEVWQSRRFVPRVFFALVMAVSLYVQVLANGLYWDSFVRVAQAARTGWLGSPNRSGAFSADRGGACDPCFEDLYPFLWLPPFNPLEINQWLLGHVVRGDDWPTAEKDAPWHRYTKLQLNVSDAYVRARVDWWLLDFRDRFVRNGVLLLLVLLAGALASIRLWRGPKARRATPPQTAPPPETIPGQSEPGSPSPP